MTELNPYAPGEAALASPLERDLRERTWYRDGNHLVVKIQSSLPPVCLHTGEVVHREGWQGTRNLYWCNPHTLWPFLLVVPVGIFSPAMALLLLAGAILLRFLTQKKITLTHWLTKRSRRNVVRSKIIGTACFVMGVVIEVFGGSLVAPVTMKGAFWIMLFGLMITLVGVFLLTRFRRWGVKAYGDGWFAVRGCSQRVLDALEHEDMQGL